MSNQSERAQFRAMSEGSQHDWDIIAGHVRSFAKGLPSRIFAHLRLLDGDYGGYPIDRLEHSRQSATRALRDGRDEAYVVMALLHDIGDTLGTFDHPEVAAAILKPFVSEKLHWIAQQHGIFQGYYFFHYLGRDRDQRDHYRGHPYFEPCAEFCEKYDQCAFDGNYESAPLEFFLPMVERVMSVHANGSRD